MKTEIGFGIKIEKVNKDVILPKDKTGLIIINDWSRRTRYE